MISVLFLFFFYAFVCADFDPCEYVKSNFELKNVTAVRECFNTHVLTMDDKLVSSLLQQVKWALEIYPYIDIAKSPPSYPSQEYYGKVDAVEAFNNLRNSLESSENIASKIFRPLSRFFASFRDGHFYYTLASKFTYEKDVIIGVRYRLPFSWFFVPDSDGSLRVYLTGYDSVSKLRNPDQDYLAELLSDGVYAKTIDGKNAFEYVSNFFGDKLNRRSLQARLHETRRMSDGIPFIVQYPPEDDVFSEHVVVFSNGNQLRFNVSFYNWYADGKENSDRAMSVPTRNPWTEVTFDRDNKVSELLRNYEPKFVQDVKDNKYVKCSTYTDINYMSINSFAPRSIESFMDELTSCVRLFDQNDYPIILDLPGNNGGYASLDVYTFSLLSPFADYSLFEAVRRTERVKKYARDFGIGREVFIHSKKCSEQRLYAGYFNSFWKSREIDDYGNGILHNRTKLFYNKYVSNDKINKYSLKKHVRKPTDIIVITDGLCISACSDVVNQFIQTGSAIIAGVGATYPGDELFAASQHSASVIDLNQVVKCSSQEYNSGIKISVTFIESFERPEGNVTLIPRDYIPYRIDAHLGVYPNYTSLYMKYDDSSFEAVLNNARKMHERYKTNCNPSNKRLFYVTEECKSSDPYAKFVGFTCGSDGKWNTSSCKISVCDTGYRVDFINDKCVINYCYSASSSFGTFIALCSLAIVLGFVIIVSFIVIFTVCLCKKNRKKDNSSYELAAQSF